MRFQGGHNAGHTLVVGNQTYKLSLLPSGLVRGKLGIIGNGVVYFDKPAPRLHRHLIVGAVRGIDPWHTKPSSSKMWYKWTPNLGETTLFLSN